MDMSTDSILDGSIQHPAFRYLPEGLRGRARVSASHHHVLLAFDSAEDVREASNALADGGVAGDAMEHHIRDHGYIVLDWD